MNADLLPLALFDGSALVERDTDLVRERDADGCTVDCRHSIVMGVVWSLRVIPLRALI